MKKLSRLRRKKHSEGLEESHQRITNETVAEHRERILAGGRRFKYPVQYARHRLVINAIIISIVAFLLAVLAIWWQLYLAQNTSTFFYRITRVVPMPVAIVDGQQVRFSNYLVGFRSQEYYLQHKEGINLYSKEYKQQLDYIKRKALDDAIADAYAVKLANARGIKITDMQIDQAIERQRQSRDGITSAETYNAILLDQFNWTPEEAREVTAARLLRQEVAFNIDKTAAEQLSLVQKKVKTEKNFEDVAATIPAFDGAKVETGVTPLVPSSNQDGGLAATAAKMKVGDVSQAIRSTTGDGYYIVKLLEKSGDDRVSYAYIKVPLTLFSKQLEKIMNGNDVVEFITVPKVESSLPTK